MPNVRSGEVVVRSGEVVVRSGEVVVRSGEVVVRSGEVVVRFGEVVVRSGEVVVRLHVEDLVKRERARAGRVPAGVGHTAVGASTASGGGASRPLSPGSHATRTPGPCPARRASVARVLPTVPSQCRLSQVPKKPYPTDHRPRPSNVISKSYESSPPDLEPAWSPESS